MERKSDADCDNVATMSQGKDRATAKLHSNLSKNKGGRRGREMWSWMWLVIPAPANTFLKKEGLQIAEASFRDYPPLANQKKAGRKAKPYRKRRTRRAGKRNRTEKGGLRVHMSCSVKVCTIKFSPTQSITEHPYSLQCEHRTRGPIREAKYFAPSSPMRLYLIWNQVDHTTSLRHHLSGCTAIFALWVAASSGHDKSKRHGTEMLHRKPAKTSGSLWIYIHRYSSSAKDIASRTSAACHAFFWHEANSIWKWIDYLSSIVNIL
jgi:hypothetical protein